MSVDDSSAEDGFELEAMREDSSWHPCQISLSPTGVGLVVGFGNEDLDNMILDKEEALTKLRFRSVPLKCDDCSHIKEGQHVLASRASQSKSLFYDAEVEKTLRVRHSNRVHCRCTFTIKWRHQDRGSLTVPSSSILKPATKCAKDHPIVAAFLSSLNSLNCCAVSFPTTLEETDYETNLQLLLEKQVKDIGNTNTASRQKSSDIQLEVEADSKGQSLCKPDSASKVSMSPLQVSHEQTHFERSAQGGSKVALDMEVSEPPPAAPSIQEEYMENRSHLSPLAARAALASLRSKLPQRLEFSVCHKEEKHINYIPDNSIHISVAMGSLQETNASNSRIKNTSATDNLSPDRAAVAVEAVAEPTDILEPMMSTAIDVSGRQQHAKAYSGTLTRGRKIKKKMETNDSDANLICSIAEDLNLKTELTSPAIAVNTGNVNDNGERKISAVKVKSGPLTSVRRSMRKMVNEENRSSSMEVRQEFEDNKPSQCLESAPSEVARMNNVPKENTHLGLHVEKHSSPVEQRTKKQKMSSTIKATRETQGTSKSSRQKRISASSTKQESRFSHRLRFLPRTRSQNKSKPS